MRKLPILPTILVALAVALMVGLGIWQLQRKGEKEALLVKYKHAENLPAIAYPMVTDKASAPLFRNSSVNCIKVENWRSVSGVNINGDSGFAHLALCHTGGGEGPGAVVAIGWTDRPDNPGWNGGLVNGVIGPDNQAIIRLVASDPVEGLQRLALPSIASIPNNHLIYAIQWFIFALAAAVIYVLAVRRRNDQK
jgi:surfeit locus 1 family protein